MKKFFLIFLIFSLTRSLSFSQNVNDRAAELGNFGQYLQGFVDNTLLIDHFKALTEYNSDHYVTMTFNIATDGSIQNMNVLKNGIPDTLISIITRIIKATDKGWTPQTSNCKPVFSDTITCYFLFANKSETLRKRVNGEEPKLNLSGRPADLKEDIFLKMGQRNYCFVFLKPYLAKSLIE